MVDSNLFLPKDAPKSLAAGAPPQTPLDELTAFYTLFREDGDEGKDEFASNLNFLTMPLW